MPVHTDLYHIAGICSYSQTWAPVWYPGKEEISRGSLVMLASETNFQPVCTELVPFPLDFDSQISWMDKCFKQTGAPVELWLPDERFAEAMSPRCPNSRILVMPESRQHHWIREGLWPADAETVPHSPLQMLGERKAREFYLACEHFLVQQVHQRIQDDEIFRFTSEDREYGVVVGGSTRFQDAGVAIYSSLKLTAKQTEPPLTCFGPGSALTVHYRDLNFLEHNKIRIPQMLLPRVKFPMVLLQSKNKQAALKDLRFLLRNLPEMAATGSKLVEQGKRRLERTDLRVKAGRAGQFPAYWDRLAS